MPYVWGELANGGIRICECGDVSLEDEMHWHEEGAEMDAGNLTEKIYVFKLNTHDVKLQEEITLAGVISGKIAKGDYYEDNKFAEIQGAYELCGKVNTSLSHKLDEIRKILDSDD